MKKEIELGDTVIPKDHPQLKSKVVKINPFMGEDVYGLENGTTYTESELDLEQKSEE